MEHNVDWNVAPHDVTARAWGRANLAGSLALLAAVVDDARFRPGMRILLDYRELDGGETTSREVQSLVEAVAARSERIGGSRCAVVVRGRVDFGLARMWQLTAGASTQLQVELFYEVDAALAWLAQVGDGDASETGPSHPSE